MGHKKLNFLRRGKRGTKNAQGEMRVAARYGHQRSGCSYLLELLNGTLVNTTALVDQVTSGGRLAGIDVAISVG
jgi:hypothetical protein